MKILDCKDIEEYKRRMYNCGGPDTVDDVDQCGEYIVGMQHMGHEIIGIFIHAESECAWMIVDIDGQLIEEDIPYGDIRFFGIAAGIKDLQKLDVGVGCEATCTHACCNNWVLGNRVTLKKYDNNSILVDDAAIIEIKHLAGNFMLDEDVPF